MIKLLTMPTGFGFFLLVSVAAHAQTGKAPCSAFHKLSDGNWSVSSPIKIEHGNSSAMLSPGLIISPGTKVAGVNIYAALQKSCPSSN